MSHHLRKAVAARDEAFPKKNGVKWRSRESDRLRAHRALLKVIQVNDAVGENGRDHGCVREYLHGYRAFSRNFVELTPGLGQRRSSARIDCR